MKNVFKLNIVLWGMGILSIPAQGQDLKSLIDLALANNLEVQQLAVNHKRAIEKENEVDYLPDTQVAVGVFTSRPETRTGAQQFKVSLKQMLPFFGTVKARKKYATALADVKYQELVVKKRKLILGVSYLYYQLFQNKASQQVVQSNLSLLKTYEEWALTAVEVGKSSVVDVLNLQIRQNELDEKNQVLREQYEGLSAELNALLNRDMTVKIEVVSELLIPERQALKAVDKLDVHPELVKYDKLYHSISDAEKLNQKQRRPLFGFGIDYISVAERPQLNFGDNGKDILMPMLSMSIPIFTKKYRSKTKQFVLEKEALHLGKQQRFKELESSLYRAKSDRNAARIQYETQNKNIRQTANATKILIKSFETGTLDFDKLLEIQELELKFQLVKIQAIRRFYAQSALINYLIQ